MTDKTWDLRFCQSPTEMTPTDSSTSNVHKCHGPHKLRFRQLLHPRYRLLSRICLRYLPRTHPLWHRFIRRVVEPTNLRFLARNSHHHHHPRSRTSPLPQLGIHFLQYTRSEHLHCDGPPVGLERLLSTIRLDGHLRPFGPHSDRHCQFLLPTQIRGISHMAGHLHTAPSYALSFYTTH